MEVNKIIEIIETHKLEIVGARLLTSEELWKVPKDIKEYDKWWWSSSPGKYYNYAIVVVNVGRQCKFSFCVDYDDVAVRPVLIIENLNSSDLNIGDKFIFNNKRFEIISDDMAFCTEDIGTCVFREDFNAKNANKYEKSDVKKYVDKWFEEATNENIK